MDWHILSLNLARSACTLPAKKRGVVYSSGARATREVAAQIGNAYIIYPYSEYSLCSL
jgi:hypothetical protein